MNTHTQSYVLLNQNYNKTDRFNTGRTLDLLSCNLISQLSWGI